MVQVDMSSTDASAYVRLLRSDSPTCAPSKSPLSSEESSPTSSVRQKQQKTDWRSIYVAGTLTFVGAVQFSLYFASLWPYLQVLDESVTEKFFGLVVSIYCVGQIIASPLVGFWSNKIRSMRSPLYMGLALMFCGNLLYFSAPLFPFHRKYVIFVARFVTGFGSANVSLLKAYATSASTGVDRSKAIALVTGGLALGMTAGPALQLIFTPLGPDGIKLTETLSISIYTAPAMMACCMNGIGCLLIHFFFVENMIGIADKSTQEKQGVSLPPYDRVALFACFVVRFCQMFIVTNMESIGTPLAMTMFAWTRTTVVRNTAIAQAVQSIFAFLTYFCYVKFNVGRMVNSLKVVMYALIGLILFHLLSYSWPFLPTTPTLYNNEDVERANHTELAGCNTDRFDWCYSLKPVNVYLYYISYVIFIGTCFPNINICLNTLFSKIIGPRPQATQQGWLQVAGSSARMVGPVAISLLYTEYGPRWSWNIEIAVIASTLALLFILRNRMVPLQVPEAFAHFQDQDDPDVVRAKKKLAKAAAET